MPEIANEQENAPPPPRFKVRDLFLGKEGLRSGWSLLLYFFLLYVSFNLRDSLIIAMRTQAHTHQPKQAATATPSSSSETPLIQAYQIPPGQFFVGEGTTFVCVLLATWVMAKIERRTAADYGLAGGGRFRRFLAGFAWGAALLSLLVGSLRLAGLLHFDACLLSAKAALRYAALWIAGFFLVGLMEEYLFRGYVQYTLARSLTSIYGWFRAPRQEALGFWTAAALISFGFGVTHQSNAGESPVGLFAAGLIGLVFCLSLWRTGSLWWAIGFHTAWDWAQSFVYGVADSGTMVQGHLLASHPQGRLLLSGGVTGPEGSLLILPVIAAGSAVVWFTLPGTRSGEAP